MHLRLCLKRQAALAADLQAIDSGQKLTECKCGLLVCLVRNEIRIINLARPGRPLLNTPGVRIFNEPQLKIGGLPFFTLGRLRGVGQEADFSNC